jgi:hypothetical protein
MTSHARHVNWIASALCIAVLFAFLDSVPDPAATQPQTRTATLSKLTTPPQHGPIDHFVYISLPMLRYPGAAQSFADSLVSQRESSARLALVVISDASDSSPPALF